MFICMLTGLITFLFSDGMTRKIRIIAERMELASKGDLDSVIEVNSSDEVGSLAKTLNWMTKSLKALTEKEIEHVKLQGELDTANLIQSNLMPPGSLQTDKSLLDSYTVALTKCGGDWWSHLKLDDRYEYLFIADATGHGPSAAMVTAIAYTVFEQVKKVCLESGTPLSPADILNEMNTIMAKENLKGITMTAAVILIDYKENTLSYANGGHVPIFYMHNNKVASLLKPGSIIGNSFDANFGEKTISIDGVSRIFAFTDGIIEAQNTDGRMYGSPRLRRHLKKYIYKSSKDLIVWWIDFNTYTEDAEIEDDFTLVSMDIKKNAPKAKMSDEAVFGNTALGGVNV